MMVEQRITVAWYVELLPDSGPCHYCAGRTSTWVPSNERFAVCARSGHRDIVIAVCGYHLPVVLARWDSIAEAHRTEGTGRAP